MGSCPSPPLWANTSRPSSWLMWEKVSLASPSASSPDGGAPRAAVLCLTSCRRPTSTSTLRRTVRRPCSVRSWETTTSASASDSSPEAARVIQVAPSHARLTANGRLPAPHHSESLDAAPPSPPSTAESATSDHGSEKHQEFRHCVHAE